MPPSRTPGPIFGGSSIAFGRPSSPTMLGAGYRPGPVGLNLLSQPGLLAFAGRGAIPLAARARSSIDPHRFTLPAQRASVKVRGWYGQARAKHEQRGVDTPAVPPGTAPDYVEMTRGRPIRPQFHHDHGFMENARGEFDPSMHKPPTRDDYIALARWVVMLEGAELIRPDLVDGTGAYRHFLFGEGRPRHIDYERFVQGDSSGQTILRSAMEDAQTWAIYWDSEARVSSEADASATRFQIYSCDFGANSDSSRYPYPATENWQKAIGAHLLWMHADVEVTVDPVRAERRFELRLTLEMEDMYNFNPHNVDITTGIPDAENGRFEVTGLGHEYLNSGSLTRTFRFHAPLGPVSRPRTAGSSPEQDRTPRPRDAEDTRR